AGGFRTAVTTEPQPSRRRRRRRGRGRGSPNPDAASAAPRERGGAEPARLIEACRQAARRTFGIARLRPEQEAAMPAVLAGRDALAALPTGFGKSLIYQVPAVMLERPTIVISPLIALMADQESALKNRGVPVIALHSRLRVAERRAALAQLEA